MKFRENILVRRIYSNIIDFVIFAILSFGLFTIAQFILKETGMYYKSGAFITFFNICLYAFILFIGNFLVFGMLFAFMKRTLGKMIAKLYIYPLKGEMTGYRMFIREVVLKQIFLFFIFMFVTYYFFVAIQEEQIFSEYKVFTSTPFIVVSIIFIVTNLVCLLLVGHPLHNIVVKTVVKAKYIKPRSPEKAEKYKAKVKSKSVNKGHKSKSKIDEEPFDVENDIFESEEVSFDDEV